ncbi:class I SAM-dependent methyltransferase [Halobaculum magnesiiphilum]|uniref:Class I SAM-dependent methyltransferase n=1 Tax=Halobaculum magnesiiphilum TaxID=1017351 RepID=A0A8T8W9H2_9EURY|nr:class I SAM-dependent methyltransferase [Halobaculum magnesiiphilum]QZP36495.1 class I SAM-dependent methyltransferase [Halobaculum magnesiiphilum]
MEGDDVAYLEAARTVDDRAHSDAATAAFRAALRGADRDAGGGGSDGANGDDAGGDDDDSDGVRVLEAGAGTCGLLRRLLADGALPTGEWVAVDTDGRVLTAGRDRLRAEATEAGYGVEPEGSTILLDAPDGDATLRVRFERGDVREVAADHDGDFDGVVARSFADLLAPAEVLALLRAAAPDGWYHLPLTFDGETRFSPSHPVDDAVVEAFHGTMRNRGRAATLLSERFREAGSPPAVDARADWVVQGDGTGGYPADEATFLRVVLDTVVASVEELGAVPDGTLADWRETREAQLARGELRYVAGNRDLFGRVP